MDYLGIKLAFRQASGRYDLIGADGADRGGAKFIQWGQDMLETLLPRFWSRDIEKFDVTVGKHVIPVPYGRSVESVRIYDSTAETPEWTALEKYKESDLIEVYPDLTYNREIRGMPLYWSTTNRRPDESFRRMFQHQFQYVNDYGSLAIHIAPTPDKTYSLEVEGTFYTKPLYDDTDTSFWSIRFPNTLVHAACYQLEVFYRNTEGAKDWMAAIMQVVEGLDNDEVRNTLTERMVMGQ